MRCVEELFKAIESCREIEEQVSRVNELFGHPTQEELDPKYECLPSRLLFIQIGGPCANTSITGINREEHTCLLEAIKIVLNGRMARARVVLEKECKKLLEDAKQKKQRWSLNVKENNETSY